MLIKKLKTELKGTWWNLWTCYYRPQEITQTDLNDYSLRHQKLMHFSLAYSLNNVLSTWVQPQRCFLLKKKNGTIVTIYSERQIHRESRSINFYGCIFKYFIRKIYWYVDYLSVINGTWRNWGIPEKQSHLHQFEWNAKNKMSWYARNLKQQISLSSYLINRKIIAKSLYSHDLWGKTLIKPKFMR